MQVTPTEITVFHRPNAAGTPWSLRLVRGVDLVVETFASEAEALQRKTYFEALLMFGLDAIADARMKHTAAQVGLGGQDTYELVARGLRVLQTNAKIDPAALVSDGIDLRLAEARKDPDLKNYKNLVSKYNAIRKGIGHLRALSLRADTMVNFLNTLKDSKGRVGHASASTKDHYAELTQSALCALGMHDPLPDLPSFEVPGPVEFFSIEEVKIILGATPTRARGFIVVALFSFIRPELLATLPAWCVNIKKRTITIPADLSKDGKRHVLIGEIVLPDGRVIPGLMDVLWEWLSVYPFEPLPWEPLRDHLTRVLGKYIHDGLRRTGATYYKALYGRAETVRMLMHSSAQTTSRHYLGATTRQLGLAFFALTPAAICFLPDRKWIYDIPRVELQRIVQLKPLAEVAHDLAVAEDTLICLCKQHGVPICPPTYWGTRVYSSAKVTIDFSAAPRRVA